MKKQYYVKATGHFGKRTDTSLTAAKVDGPKSTSVSHSGTSSSGIKLVETTKICLKANKKPGFPDQNGRPFQHFKLEVAGQIEGVKLGVWGETQVIIFGLKFSSF